MTSSNVEDQWVAIQHKTFVNWANEQLSLGNRHVSSLATDLCDGVRLVALVEALQLQKVGRVYGQPSGRIQMMHNVGLALKAIKEDRVKLVNIGPDDIVGGNLKLILGLLWHLILRYQISANKTKSPPKKLMLLWFQNAIPDLTINNFTTCWQDGIALNALLDYCKPGIAKNWRSLRPENRVENCRLAMTIAKDELGIPRVITPEDFASENLDDLSSMTYLSYFIRKNSTGYYSVMNWVCRQLKTANVSNLTTDWNDGTQLCSLVQSLGGDIPGYPHLDTIDHLGNCQKALDAGETLGVTPILTASELCDPSVDHLAVMAYLSKLQRVKPRKGKADKIKVDTGSSTKSGQSSFVDERLTFTICHGDVDVQEDKVKATVQSQGKEHPALSVNWENKIAECSFLPKQPGIYKVQVFYDDVEITESPFDFKVTYDFSKVKATCDTETCTVGNEVDILVTSPFQCNKPRITATSEAGKTTDLSVELKDGHYLSVFKPLSVGSWTVVASLDGQPLNSFTLRTFDPSRAKITGPDRVVSGQMAICTVSTHGCGTDEMTVKVEDSNSQRVVTTVQKKSEHVYDVSFACIAQVSFYVVKASLADEIIAGSPLTIDVVDPSQVVAYGDGLVHGTIGVEALFKVDRGTVDGNVTATVDVDGYQLPISREEVERGVFEFSYIPPRPGLYTVRVHWNDLDLEGSPYKVPITDKSCVFLLDDLELLDENDHVALTCEQPTILTFDISQAGPGVLMVEMLTPDGKHTMNVQQDEHIAKVAVFARHEGLHYVHIYWSQSPLSLNPILAFCPGPLKPVDASKVILRGQGLTTARSPVPAEIFIDGREAGPGVPKVALKGVQSTVPSEMTPLKYDRYRCTYICPDPGSFLLYVYWSGDLVPGCPYKVSVTPKGFTSKVKVWGDRLDGCFIGQELRVEVDTSASGPGDITALCYSQHAEISCDVSEQGNNRFVIKTFPSSPEKHRLSVKYDGEHVPGSPFVIRVGEPPNPSQVNVFGPGIEHGLMDRFQSSFIVDTHGAGSGQLSVKIKGPRGGFRVEMQRESEMERMITCRYDAVEPGEYLIHVRWSGVDVPGSPFSVHLVNTINHLNALLLQEGLEPYQENQQWRAEV